MQTHTDMYNYHFRLSIRKETSLIFDLRKSFSNFQVALEKLKGLVYWEVSYGTFENSGN